MCPVPQLPAQQGRLFFLSLLFFSYFKMVLILLPLPRECWADKRRLCVLFTGQSCLHRQRPAGPRLHFIPSMQPGMPAPHLTGVQGKLPLLFWWDGGHWTAQGSVISKYPQC